MKRLSLFGATALATLLLSSCSNEEMIERTTVHGDAVVTATIDGINSRVNIAEESGAFSWSAEDNIGIYTTDTQNKFKTFTLKSGEGTGNGTFEGSFGDGVKSTLCAVYPADGSHKVTDKVLTFHMSNTYKWAKGNTNVPMLASISSEGSTAYYFTHLGGAFRFIVTNWPTDAAKVVFTTSGNITGDFDIDLSQQAPYSIASSDAKNGSKSVTIEFPESGVSTLAGDVEKFFYIPVPTGTYEGYNFEIQDKSGTRLHKYVSVGKNTVNRKTFLDIPKITFTSVDGSITAEASSADDLKTLFSSDEPPTSIMLTGDLAKQVTEVAVPTAYTSTGQTEAKPLALVFKEIPAAESGSGTNTVTIKEESTSSSTPAEKSVSVITVSVPGDVASQSAYFSVEVNMPNNTVLLSTNGDKSTYNKVTSTTAKQTLIVDKGVTVNELTVKGGNVRIEGTVKKLIIDSSNSTTDSIVITGLGICEEYQNSSSLNIKFKYLWDGISKKEPEVKENVYQINDAAELAYFQLKQAPTTSTGQNLPATMSQSAKLNNDIDLGNHPWVGIVMAEGTTFDGGEHTISNVYSNEHALTEQGKYTPEACVGFFAATKSGCTIKGITIDGFKVENEGADAKWSGALVGYSLGTVYENCHAKNVDIQSDNGNAYRIGGLIGFIGSGSTVETITLTSCSVEKVTIKGSYSLGGLVGTLHGVNGTFSKCTVKEVTILQNAASPAVVVGKDNNTKDWAGNLSKFIGDTRISGTLTIDKECSVDKQFTEEEAKGFGFENLVANGSKWKLNLSTSPFISSQVDAGTIKVDDKTLQKGTDYNHFTMQETGGSGIDKYNPVDGTWAN